MRNGIYSAWQLGIDAGKALKSFRPTALLFFAVIITMSACAGAPPANDRPGGGFIKEGRITYEGSNPFDRRLNLECPDGSVWIVIGPRFESDLAVLDGHIVGLTGKAVKTDASRPAIEIAGYELLPVDGLAAAQGVICVEDTFVFFDQRGNAGRYRMEGPLRNALFNFDGHRAWVWGEWSARRGEGPGRVRAGGYEILGPAEQASSPVRP